MQLVDVVGNRDQDALCQDIRFATVQVLPEIHVFLYGRKRVFHLYAMDYLKILSPYRAPHILMKEGENITTAC